MKTAWTHFLFDFNGWSAVQLWVGLLTFATVWPAAESVHAQETAESRAFRTAAGAFQDRIYDRAEQKFREFVASFPQSPMLHEAILLQAQAALKQTNLAGAVTLLNAHVAKAGLLTDQYRYWIAMAHFEGRNYSAAAESFSLIARQFANSPLLLEAGHGEALARLKLREFSRVISLLQDPNGAFQQGIKTRPNDQLSVRGHLLLAEALFEQRRYRDAEDAVGRLLERNLAPELNWDRNYLLCRLHIADQRQSQALAQTTNLISLARETDNPNLIADSVALQASILHQLGRTDDAIRAFTANLADSVPAERRRLALLNIIELKLGQNQILDAEKMLEQFLVRRPDDAASDVVMLTSGELHLKLHLNQLSMNAAEVVKVPETNHLQQALVHFEKLLDSHTNSLLRGKARLNQGWCLWLDHKISESAAAFRAATELLPFSEDLAVARFKLADALYAQGDYTNALRFYRGITNDFPGLARVKETLFDHVLFQIVRANIEIGDEAAASATMQQIINWYPDSSFSEKSMWLVGQQLIGIKQPAEARKVFQEFVRRFPTGPLLPRVELTIARAYFLEDDWMSALSHYEEWLRRHPTDEMRPRAEFNLAWTNDKAGRRTNALHLFASFAAQFPTNELAPRAQYWVAEEFYREGNFVEALRQFQILFENTNWPPTKITYQARYMAGLSAFAAQLWKNADDHFTVLLNDPSRSDDLVPEAFFALGDTRRNQDANPENPLQKFADARDAYFKIPQLFPNHRLVPLAWGSIGDCLLQLASKDAKQYGNAIHAYGNVMTNVLADISIRSQAEYGLARALELQASGKIPDESAVLLKAAFEHYYNIVIGDNLRDKEEADAFWLEKAGLAAARVAEEQSQWSVAINIYERLVGIAGLAPIWPRLQDKIKKVNRAREQSLGDKD